MPGHAAAASLFLSYYFRALDAKEAPSRYPGRAPAMPAIMATISPNMRLMISDEVRIVDTAEADIALGRIAIMMTLLSGT
jgi:hypothetical protein